MAEGADGAEFPDGGGGKRETETKGEPKERDGKERRNRARRVRH